MRISGTRIFQITLLAALLATGTGCSWFHHGSRAKCREPAIGANAKNLPPLKVPPGLDAPDTRNAIKIPPLTEPERARTPKDPCLSSPPSYGSAGTR
jgi:uncharacterized lipoprotein